MSLISYPLINGVRHDFSSIRASIGTFNIFGITAVDYTIAKPVGDVYGTSAQRLGRTRGQLKVTGSLTMYQTEFAALTQMLGASSYALMETEFPMIVQYRDGGVEQLITDTLSGCLITNIGNSHSSGNNALVVKLDLDINEVMLNGVRMLSSTGLPQSFSVDL